MAYITLSCPVPTTTTSTTTSTTTPSPLGNIEFDWAMGSSLVLNATAANVNSVPLTYIIGGDFPFNSGGPHVFSTTETGTNQTVTITLDTTYAGQSITITDSNLVAQCANINTGTNDVVFTNVAIDNITSVRVIPSEGTCP